MVAFRLEFHAHVCHQSVFPPQGSAVYHLIFTFVFISLLAVFFSTSFHFCFFFPLFVCSLYLEETLSPCAQLQVWALSIIENEKVGDQIRISSHLPLLYAWVKTPTPLADWNTWVSVHLLAALHLMDMSAGYTSHQLLLNMKYSCSLFFLLCIFASLILEEGRRRHLRLHLGFCWSIHGTLSRRHIRWTPLAITLFRQCYSLRLMYWALF